MPIVIPKDLPAAASLQQENIFVMLPERAKTQDIRPLEIAILNLMPTKIETETQLMRLLSNSPLQINITLLETATYRGKHTASEHLDAFYKSYEDVKGNKFDGMIVTGAPVEKLDYDDVKYWAELEEIFDYIEDNVTSTIFICWGAQAAMYHYYGIPKYDLPQKKFGIFRNLRRQYEPLLKGMDDYVYIPHSRHSQIDSDAIRRNPDLVVLAESDETGVSIARSTDSRKIFLFGHSEYDRYTLKNEYERDLAKGLDIAPPEHYFADESHTDVKMCWQSTANLLYYNWLNYCVYQQTPYNINDIGKKQDK